MTPEQRSTLVLRTFHHMQSGQYDYATLSDIDRPDNYVQFAVTDEDRHGILFEVTRRNYPDQHLPILTQQQTDDIVGLGLSRETNPNHSAEFTDPDPDMLARLSERSFEILGSPHDFTLDVNTGFWAENPVWQRLKQAGERHNLRGGHRWPFH